MLDITLALNNKLIYLVSLGGYIPHKYSWMLLLFVVIFISLSLYALISLVLLKIGKKLEHTSNLWDDALLHAVKRPLASLVWIIGIIWSIQVISAYTDTNWNKYIQAVWELGIVFLIGWFFIRLLTEFEKSYSKAKQKANKEADIATIHAINKLLKASVAITTLVIVLHTLGFSVSGVLAVGGIGGIAIGFAAQDLLANFFGAIMIFVDRPFKVGEWVRSPDREIEGTVEEIGWRMTRIRTFDQRPLFVPNRVFTSIAVETPSRMFNRRIKENIGLRYEDLSVIDKVVADIKTYLETNTGIDKSKTLIVGFDNYGDFALHIMIYCFTTTTVWTQYQEIKQEALLEIRNIVHKNGADFAFPTSVVQLENMEPKDQQNIKK